MHDPDVVAFKIRRPWPRRERTYDSVRPGRAKVGPRWRFKLHHDCGTCSEEKRAKHAGKRIFPWWRPSSWSPFWTLAGRGFYWPSVITVWHREPGGRDSGEVCKHYRKERLADGTYRAVITHGWRLHVHHWKIQVHPLQNLRRWLLTRCEWCGGRSRKGDRVSHAMAWDGPRGRWWRGEPGLYHGDCASVSSAHRECTCIEPLCADYSETYGPYGKCARCGGGRSFGRSEEQTARMRKLATVPRGQRTPEGR